MKVKELIAELSKLPPDLDVEAWDAGEDDDVPVTGAILELGHSKVRILLDEDPASYVTATADELDQP